MRKKHPTNNLFLFAIVALVFASCASKPKTAASDTSLNRTKEAVAMLREMASFQERKTFMFGHHDDTCYGHCWDGRVDYPNPEDRSDTRDVCGDFPGIIGFDLGDIENGVDKNLDGVPFDKIRQEAVAQYMRGGMVTMSWHCDNPLTGGNAWDTGNKGTVESILPGGAQYETFQQWLDRVAVFLSSIKTPKGMKVPILFRPWHEHTGSWFWWGQGNCTKEQYVALWRMTVDFMQAHGVNNLLWSYSSGAVPIDTLAYLDRYPGDDIVDVMGFDAYQGTDREQYIQTVTRSLAVVVEAAAAHHKVPAVTETGYETIPDADWWTGTLLEAIGSAPIAYVLVWRNAYNSKHHFGVYPGHLSESDFMAFYDNPRTLFAADLK